MTLPPNTDGPEQNGTPGAPDSEPGAPEAPQPPMPPQAPQPPASSQPSAPQPPQSPSEPQAPQAPQAPSQPQYAAPGSQPQYAAPGQPQYSAAPGAAPQYPQQAQGGYAGEPGPGGVFDGASDPDDMSRPLYGASFAQAIRRFFKGYAKFDGRASRSEFWFAFLFQFLVTLIPGIFLMIGLFGVFFSAASSYDPYGYSNAAPAAGSVAMLVIGGILYGVIGLALLVPSIAIGWRRLHDANFPGPLWLINIAGFIPFINYIGWIANIAYLVLTIMPSKPEGRRFDRS